MSVRPRFDRRAFAVVGAGCADEPTPAKNTNRYLASLEAVRVVRARDPDPREFTDVPYRIGSGVERARRAATKPLGSEKRHGGLMCESVRPDADSETDVAYVESRAPPVPDRDPTRVGVDGHREGDSIHLEGHGVHLTEGEADPGCGQHDGEREQDGNL